MRLSGSPGGTSEERGAHQGEGFWKPGQLDCFSEALWFTKVPSGGSRDSGSLGTENLVSKVQRRMRFAH